MTTFYCSDNDTAWTILDDSVDLKDFARSGLNEQAGLDSDSGYYAFYEFWRDGVVTYGFAEYDGWSDFYNLSGELNTFEYGSLEYIKSLDTWYSNWVEPNPYSPVRDYIKL